MLIYQVETKHIEALWPHVSHLLFKAIDVSLGETNLDLVKQYLLGEDQQLWLGLDEETQTIKVAFTTEIISFATGTRHLHVHLVGAVSHTMDEWLHAWSEPVEQFCRDHNVKHVRLTGRAGWEPSMRSLGYKKYYTVMVKELEDA